MPVGRLLALPAGATRAFATVSPLPKNSAGAQFSGALSLTVGRFLALPDGAMLAFASVSPLPQNSADAQFSGALFE